MTSIVEMKKLGYPVIFDGTHSVQKPGGNVWIKMRFQKHPVGSRSHCGFHKIRDIFPVSRGRGAIAPRLLKCAKDVFDIEINALNQTKMAIGTVYEEIVNLLIRCDGKIILCGMGKSGHVARWELHCLLP